MPVAEGGTGASASLTGILTGNGSSAMTASTVTQYGTVVAGASNAVSSVAPSATSGVPLISQGAAANPAYGTAVVPGGGTGVATLTTPYGVLCAGTTATGPVQTLAALGASGTVLTSNGAAALPSFQAVSGGITTINGDSGSATGSTVTLNGTTNLISFSASGSTITATLPNIIFNSTPQNIYVGNFAGNSSGASTQNTCLGWAAGGSLSSNGFNTLIGHDAGASLTSGNENTMIGHNAGISTTTGAFNVLIGNDFTNVITTRSNNILIGNRVNSPADNALVIGAGTGTGQGQINNANISGIRGITTTNNNAIAVLIDSSGQLGTVSSSRRYKKNIQDMFDESNAIYHLRPVTFEYKQYSNKSYGLIAEEVEKTFPELVVHNEEGLPESVKYHDLPVLLLNEIQKLNKRINHLESKLAQKA